MQRVSSPHIPGPTAYLPLEQEINDHFLIELIKAPEHLSSKDNHTLLRELSKLPIKSGGIAIPDPSEPCTTISTTPKEGTMHLTKALKKEADWALETHKETMKTAKMKYRTDKLEKVNQSSHLQYPTDPQKDNHQGKTDWNLDLLRPKLNQWHLPRQGRMERHDQHTIRDQTRINTPQM